MALIKTTCPRCGNENALRDENTESDTIRCMKCEMVNVRGELLLFPAYSTEWWDWNGVKTQRQVCKEKERHEN